MVIGLAAPASFSKDENVRLHKFSPACALKYEGANGPPGKAKTVVELCADKGGVEMPGLAEMPDPCRHAASFSPDISRP